MRKVSWVRIEDLRIIKKGKKDLIEEKFDTCRFVASRLVPPCQQLLPPGNRRHPSRYKSVPSVFHFIARRQFFKVAFDFYLQPGEVEALSPFGVKRTDL